DGVLAAYVEGRERSAADLQRVAIAQTRAGVLHPVYAGSAATGAGVAELMTGIVTYLPAIPPATEVPPSGTALKIERGGAGGKIPYVRLFGGAVRPRDRIVLGEGRHATIAVTETFDGGAWVRTPAVTAGQIGRLHGLAAVRVGDTFGPPPAHDHRGV